MVNLSTGLKRTRVAAVMYILAATACQSPQQASQGCASAVADKNAMSQDSVCQARSGLCSGVDENPDSFDQSYDTLVKHGVKFFRYGDNLDINIDDDVLYAHDGVLLLTTQKTQQVLAALYDFINHFERSDIYITNMHFADHDDDFSRQLHRNRAEHLAQAMAENVWRSPSVFSEVKYLPLSDRFEHAGSQYAYTKVRFSTHAFIDQPMPEQQIEDSYEKIAEDLQPVSHDWLEQYKASLREHPEQGDETQNHCMLTRPRFHFSCGEGESC